MVVDEMTNKLAGYDNITQADLRKSLEQAKHYADHIHLINVCLQGHAVPKKLLRNVIW